jgi:ankyrin repeat protein
LNAKMKHLLLTTIAAVVLVGCATPTQSPSPPLFDAVRKGDIEAVRKHLGAGADVNTKDEDGYTLLTVAVAYGSKEIVELLIFNGVDVNAKNDGGSTPLNIATAQGHKEIVELLILNGVDVNAFDPQVREKSIEIYEVADILRKHGGNTGEELK